MPVLENIFTGVRQLGPGSIDMTVIYFYVD